MANISFRDFSLSQTTITGRRTPNVTVDAVHIRYKRDENNQQTTETDGVNVDIIASRGKTQTVKLPLSCKETTDKITDALKEGKVVTVNFGEKASTLRGTCYAMLRDGVVISGVSCKAEEINIVKIENLLDDDLLDDIDY